MKRFSSFLSILLLIISLCACGKIQTVPTWQEQYDLGVRYLSEGDYEEAVIAFTAAIEIDPKQADAYIRIADIYLEQGDYEQALTVLTLALSAAEHTSVISDKLAEVEEIMEPSPESSPESSFAYNEYGGTEFTQRNSYRDIESMESQEVSVLKEAMALTIANDMHGLYRLWKQCIESSGLCVIRTIMDGYKVEFSFDGQMEFMQMDIQFRPENGTGYAAHITEKQGESVWSSRWASCNCSNWQWNGTASVKDESGDGHIVSGSVQLIDSLRDGVLIQDYTYFTTTTVYQDGLVVERDGKPQVSDGVFWGITSGFSSPSDQFVLDELYW